MLKVALDNLERAEVVLDRCGLPRDWGVSVPHGLCQGPITVHAVLSKSGEIVLAHGWVSGSMRQTCDRCLKDFDMAFKSFFEVHFTQETGEEETEKELKEEDVDHVLFSGDVIDLTEQIRQAVELGVPMRALCREDCRGICAGCGVDLNLGSCRCSDPPGDDRWAVLKKFKPQN